MTIRDEAEERTILVLGGTGKTGRRVVERLTARGPPVRAGSRSGEPPFGWEGQATPGSALRETDRNFLCRITEYEVIMKSGKILVLGITALAFSASGQKSFGQTSELEEAKEAIAASNAIYWQSYVKNEPRLFTEHYAEDACILAPGGPAMCGDDAPAEFFEESYEGGTRGGEFITQEVFGVGDGYVAEVGLLKAYDEAGELKGEGKYLVLWKKTSEGWKMFRDAFSSNRSD